MYNILTQFLKILLEDSSLTMTATEILDKYSTPDICAQALQNVLPMLGIYSANQEPHRIGMFFRCENDGNLVHEFMYQEDAQGVQAGLDFNVERKIRQSKRTLSDGSYLYDAPKHYKDGDFPYAGCIKRNNRYYAASGRNQRMDETIVTAWYNEELNLCEQMMTDKEKQRSYDMDPMDRGVIKKS